MIIKEMFSRDYIDNCIADMEAIGYEYNGTDNRGRLIFDSIDGNSTQAFPDWEDVRNYLDNGATPFDLDAYLKKDVNECDKLTIKEETEEDIVEYRLEAADYAMYKAVQCSYVEIVSDNTFGKYEVRYNNATVTVEFELGEDTAKYVYTINGEGPYAHDSYEYIREDIMDYIDTHFEDEDDLFESCMKEENSSKADDIDFIMNKYVDNKPVSGKYGSYDKIEIIDNKGKGKYTVSCNGYSVDIDFDLGDNSAKFVYTIDDELSKYKTNSYQQIVKDIAQYIDYCVRHYGYDDDDLDESQCLTESSLPDWQDTIMVEIRNILKNNRIYADIYDDTDFRGNDDAFVLCVEIENGDWKHEHKKADILITDTVNHYDNMEITKISEETIGDSEDDTYSSIHKFHILRYPDDNGFDFDDIEQLDIKFPKRESRSRRNRKRVNEARYSDVVPYENRKYWYFTTHGLGPGTIPKGVKVLDVKEGQNKKGTWGDFICLDAVLNTDELKEFDLIELAPDNVYESNNNRNAFKVGDKVNSKHIAANISFNDGTIIDIDRNGLCTIECADGTIINDIRQDRLVKSYKKESTDTRNLHKDDLNKYMYCISSSFGYPNDSSDCDQEIENKGYIRILVNGRTQYYLAKNSKEKSDIENIIKKHHGMAMSVKPKWDKYKKITVLTFNKNKYGNDYIVESKFNKSERTYKRKSIKAIKESFDLTGYTFKFYKDGYKIYSKFDKTLNKGLWVAQEEGGEPFEITYEQARGFEPINPTDRIVQHKLRKALKRESASNIDINRNGLYAVRCNESVYTNAGFKNRADYLQSLADDFGVDINTVKDIAYILGPSEDFDGLVTQVEDIANDLEETEDFDPIQHYLDNYRYVVCSTDNTYENFDFIFPYDTYEFAGKELARDLIEYDTETCIFDTCNKTKTDYSPNKLDTSKLDEGGHGWVEDKVDYINPEKVGNDIAIENIRAILDMCEVKTEKY